MIPRYKIVMFATANIASYATLAAEINRRYCSRHGYGFSFEQYDALDWHPTFEMVRVLQRHLGSAEYLLWLDADACVVNFSQTLDPYCDNGNDLVIAGHEFGFDAQGRRRRFEIDGIPCGLNAGVAMFRSSDWTAMFLDRWEAECRVAASRNAPFAEQGVLQQMFVKNTLAIQAHTNVVVPASRFNRGDDHGTDVCDFVLHLWGVDAGVRQQIFREIHQGRRPDVEIVIPRFEVT